jgi:D-alanyl-D-alanine carboxypeptidase
MRQPALVRTFRSPASVFSWLFLALLAATTAGAPAAAARKPVYASIVVDANTGEVLHAVNADTRTYPASTAKIMTLYLLFEALERGKVRMDTPLRVSDRAASQAPSKLGIEAGRTVSVRDAMLALVTKSANDMAVVVAEALAGSEEAFAEQMTRRARALGMRATRFRNASGLPDPDQVTTARDLAILGMAVLRDFPRQYQVFSVHDFVYEGAVHNNHNKLLGRYPGVDGIKTGYIRASGFNLVASAEREGRRLVAVVLGGNAPGWRDVHMMQLLDKAFDKRPPVQVAKAEARQPAPIARELKRRPGQPAPEPVIATATPQPPEPAYAEDLDMDQPTIADLISDDAAEAIAASGNWGVQVGAFKQADNARRAADDARRLLGGALNGARPVVEETRSRAGSLYQARLVGMTEGEARAACREFKKKKLACLAVPPAVPNGKTAQQSAQGSK